MGGGLVRTGEIKRVEFLGKSESQSFQGRRRDTEKWLVAMLMETLQGRAILGLGDQC